MESEYRVSEMPEIHPGNGPRRRRRSLPGNAFEIVAGRQLWRYGRTMSANPISSNLSGRDGPRLLALFLGVFLLHALGTWSLPLIDRDEPRFAEASREMIQRGDWLVPWLNDRP